MAQSALRFSHPGKLQLGTARLLKHELVAGDFHQINRGSERRFDFNSALIAELISSADVADEDRAVFGKFPNGFARTARHMPFTDNGRIPAADHRRHQNCKANDP